MANVISGNAYRVLGLDSSASQKDISRRSKEIINLLKIDDVPEYDIDMNLVSLERTEESVKNALQNLSSPTRRIQDYFFWFQIADSEDEKALEYISSNKPEQALSIWRRKDGETAKGYVAKRNLAILESLLLLSSGNSDYTVTSLGFWKEIISTDKFWASFIKVYELNDEVGTSDKVFDDFKQNAVQLLADLYADIADEQKDNDIMLEFSKVFAVKGARIQKDVLNPVFESIHTASERLENLNISEDKQITEEEIAELKRLINGLRKDFEKLKSVGLYDDSQARAMRDTAATAIRAVTFDLYVNLNESSKSMSLLKVAIEICGTAPLRSKLEDDMKDLKRSIEDDKVTKPINDLMEAEDYQQALELIIPAIPDNADNEKLTEFLRYRVKWAVMGIAMPEYNAANTLTESSNWKQASPKFKWVRDFVMSYISYFNFDQEGLNVILARIDSMSSSIGASTFDQIDTYRKQLIAEAKEAFEDEFEETLLIVLIDCTAYANLAHQIPKIRRKNQFKSWLYSGLGIGIFLIFAAISGSGNNSSTSDSGSSSAPSSGSTRSDAQAVCTQQYNALKAQVTSIDNTMNAKDRAGDTAGYNALVPQENQLVDQLNAKAHECNAL